MIKKAIHSTGLSRTGGLFFLFVMSFDASAQSCDCTEIIGSCTATIVSKPTGDRAGLYGADLKISASASQCAKVEYFIDNTPAFTILPNGHSGTDRVLGTGDKPITPERITFQSCRVCKSENRSKPVAISTPKSEAEIIFGNALNNDHFNPNSKEETFNRLSNRGGGSGSDISTMLNILQGVQMQQQAIQSNNSRATSASQGDVYQTGGGLVDESAPINTEATKASQRRSNNCGGGPNGVCK
jgi:hypothetical protein